MSSNPFKAFIPYTIHPAVCSAPALRLPDEMAPYLSVDPTGGSWRTVGLIEPLGDDIVHDLDGGASLLTVQFNERMLPGKVRDEKLQIRKDKLEAQEGRKLTKKEYAELREEIEFDLLPKAFIRRVQVPVLFVHPNLMFVCTSSQKRADDTVSVLCAVFDKLEPRKIATVRPTGGMLTTLASDEQETDNLHFGAAKSAVLKGDDDDKKKTIRIKDRDIYGHEVVALLETGDYDVTELAIDVSLMSSGRDGLLSMVMTDSFIFKRCTLVGVESAKHKDDLHAFAWLSATTYKQVLTEIIVLLGGLAPVKKEVKPTDDDEEVL